MEKKEKKKLTPREEVEAIRRSLKHLTFKAVVKSWLSMGNSRLNAVLGSAELGIAFGKIIEFYGPESQGKTLLALLVAAICQKSGVKVAWVDLENSFDDDWVKAQGLEPEWVYLFQPQIGTFPGEKEPRLQTAEELFQEVEEWMAKMHREDQKRLLVVVDSVAAILVEDEAEAGLADQNMRTKLALSSFMSKMLRRWVALVQNYSAAVIFINQVRMSPTVRWGNPEVTTGGKSLKFYASVRVRVRRAGKNSGRMTTLGKIVGLRGILTNVKNKVGGGSLEGATCGFETKFGKKSWRFVTAAEVKKTAEEEAE